MHKNHPESDLLNQELQTHLENLKAYERKEAQAGRPLVLSCLSLNQLQKRAPGLSFTDFWEQGIENNSQLEYETKRTHRSALKRFREFQEEVNFMSLLPNCSGRMNISC